MEAGKKKKNTADGFLIFLVLLLVICGLIFLYSTSAYNGRVKFHDSAYYFKKQLFATSLGLMAMYLVSFMDYHYLVKLAPVFYGLSLLLSLAVLGTAFTGCNEKEEEDNLELVWELESDKGRDTYV